MASPDDMGMEECENGGGGGGGDGGSEVKMDASSSSPAPAIPGGSKGPGSSSGTLAKNYKITLCHYYLQGPCKNGENCSFAHGTSELRTYSGQPLLQENGGDPGSGAGGMAGEGSQGSNPSGSGGGSGGRKSPLDAKANNSLKFKTTLCTKFVSHGVCNYGPTCKFAHGVQELRKAAEMAHLANSQGHHHQQGGSAGPNVNYKTMLCKKYTSGMYCPFGEECQYAHGMAELRSKPAVVPAALLPEEIKKRRIEKAKKMPGYKTKLCQNYEKNGECEYEDICHFAHGEGELREASQEEIESMHRGNPFYKTAMCKNHKKGECTYGEQCVYAHEESELRPATVKAMGQQPNPGMALSPAYKTTLCKNYSESGHCSFGGSCQFAHGPAELRVGGVGGGGGHRFGPMGPMGMHHHHGMMGPYGQPGMMMAAAAAAAAAAANARAAASSNPKFKTVMCQSVMTNGVCPRGASCTFAHSRTELRSPNAGHQPQQHHAHHPHHQMMLGVVPSKPDQPLKYKTTMCTSVLENKGYCQRGDDCNFAHSLGEMRAAQAADPKFKTELCKNYLSMGYCERQDNCKFAHGATELRPIKPPGTMMASYAGVGSGSSGNASKQQENYKTTMCRHAVNGLCQRGDSCTFAHSAEELRVKHPGGHHLGGGQGHHQQQQQGSGGPFGGASSGGGAAGSGSHHHQHHHQQQQQQQQHSQYANMIHSGQAAVMAAAAMTNNFSSFGGGGDPYSAAVASNNNNNSSSSNAGGNGAGGSRNDFFMGGDGGMAAFQNGSKRKKTTANGAKTVLCQNYSTFGHCQYGESCAYAHGEAELAVNKRQRF